MTLRSVVLLAALAGCGGGPVSQLPDLSLPLTDQQVCDQSCSALISCGVQYDFPGCTANCQGGATVFRACAREAGANCNALALCAFKQYAASFCPGGVGVPAGATSCRDTAMCQGACNVGNPTASCGCSCNAALDPAKALNLLINDQCAAARCASCNFATFDGPACNVCAAQLCGNNPCATS